MHKQRIVILDPADPDTGAYNALVLVMDCLQGRFPIEKAVTFAGMIAHNVEPEPANDSKNRLWRSGSRNLIIVTILWLCVEQPENATLTEVSRLIRDASALEAMLKECMVSDAWRGELAVMARDIWSQGKYFDDFRTAAALALNAFSAAGELASVVRSSTFRWFDCKTDPLTIYVCCNLSESRVFAPWLRLMAECATLELELSPGNVPVHFCLEEATNISGFDISSKLTALRASGVRAHIIFQERSEVEKSFGKHALETICGEVDLEQYFGFSDTKLVKEIEERLGMVEVMKPGYSTGENPWDAYQESAGFQRRPLLPAYDMLYRMPPTDQIVFIRSRKLSLKPIHCQKLRYDAVKEWIDALDDNPIEGGKLQGPPTISLEYTRSGVRVRSFRRTGPRIDWARVRRASAFLPPLWAVWAAVWLSLGYAGLSHLVSMFT